MDVFSIFGLVTASAGLILLLVVAALKLWNRHGAGSGKRGKDGKNPHFPAPDGNR